MLKSAVKCPDKPQDIDLSIQDNPGNSLQWCKLLILLAVAILKSLHISSLSDIRLLPLVPGFWPERGG